jgi:spore coat protein A, manganese oxidase
VSEKPSITRREFLQQGGMLAAGAMLPQRRRRPQESLARPTLDPASLAAFVDPLPIPKVLQSDQLRPSPVNPSAKVPYYRLAMKQFESKVHRDMKPTRFWGFESTFPGPTIETQSGKGILVEWVNELPISHFLPIDHNLHGAEADKPDVRTVVHMHGAKTLPESDGYPENWFVPGKSAVYYYPNEQDAALLWYHDHALGINRLNIFAGLFGLFIIRDSAEDALNLPKANFEIPLVLCDRLFDLNGQLYYPVSPYPSNPWVSEFFGNAILVNGKLLPYLEVEARKYRFRVLNGANSRFFHFSFSNDKEFHQIGTDQGLLPAPVALKNLTLAPAERADLIVDFSDCAGEQILLMNDSSSPVMQFKVARGKVMDTSSLPSSLRPATRINESEAVKTRSLMLAEIDDLRGDPATMLLNNTRWKMPVTENPVLNSIEIWNLMNVSDDAHPIHLHLVRFQILDRRRFDTFAYQSKGTIVYRGAAIPPEANEMGWKDTVRADPGMITRIIVRFEGYTGRYVWHCHVLEHEDNEMMRPYEVIVAKQ